MEAGGRDCDLSNRSMNVFRLAVLDYLDTATSDALALPAVCLLHVIMMSTGTEGRGERTGVGTRERAGWGWGPGAGGW